MKTIKQTEKDLNDYYSDCLSEEQAVDALIYLTNKTRCGKSVTKARLRVCYYNRTMGSLLKRLDVIAFNVSKAYD